MKNSDFSRNLIKGGIAEMVFERMFAEARGFLIIPFGYEKTVNILTQINKDKESFDLVRSMPDYVLVDKKSEDTYIVEVKYKNKKNFSLIKRDVEKIRERGWKKIWYFLATPEGFYFAKCSDLIENPKSIENNKLPESMISKKLQEKYLKMLNEFEK